MAVADEAGDGQEEEPALGTATLAYLDALAAGAFKRQEELDESVWRSLPFFAAALALAVTIVSRVAAAAPAPALHAYAVVVDGAFLLSLASFGWALRWFYDVVRPRAYDYPPGPASVREFAERMAAYYARSGDVDHDAAVVDELRRMMIGAHATATRKNLLHNRSRLEARGQLILFLMAGFVMTLACEAIIYGHDLADQATSGDVGSDGRRSAADAPAAAGGREARPAEGLHGGAGREVPALDGDAQARPQIVTGRPPRSASAPPPPARIEKNEGAPIGR